MEEIESWIYLNAIPGLGPLKAKALLDKFGSPRVIFKASTKELSSVAGIGQDLVERIKNKEKWINLTEELTLTKKLGCKLVSFEDTHYPPLLKNIPSPPPLLYVKGELHQQDYKMPLAIVGTRRASYYGRMMSTELAGELAGSGFTIISGLARGIDTCAHEGALKREGRTLAVLGSGLNLIYPPENRELSERIAHNGALISEFTLNTPPDRHNFPRRNRIISGLSLGVVVVEAGARSGALITANFALEQGREVFAVPGKVDSPHARGTHKLIQDGAKLVIQWRDIASEVMPQISWEGNKENLERPLPVLGEDEEKIYSLLSSEPLHIEELIRKTHFSSPAALSLLLSMELRGLVRQLPGKFFVKVK